MSSRRLLVLIMVVGLFAALPISASAQKAAAPFVQIAGPKKLKVAKIIEFQIGCLSACNVSVTTKLIVPQQPVLVSTVKTTFNAGDVKVDRLTLNNAALSSLKSHYRGSRYKVIVRAKNLETKARRTLRKAFRFKLSGVRRLGWPRQGNRNL